MEISEPLFPGYIFVGVPHEDRLQKIEAAIRKLGLFFYFLRDMSNKYHSMTADELEKMVQSGQENAVTCYDGGIRVGRRVKVSVGPYTGVVGKITRMDKRGIQLRASWLKKDLIILVNRANYLVLEPA